VIVAGLEGSGKSFVLESFKKMLVSHREVKSPRGCKIIRYFVLASGSKAVEGEFLQRIDMVQKITLRSGLSVSYIIEIGDSIATL
jgi:hypothetical protein